MKGAVHHIMGEIQVLPDPHGPLLHRYKGHSSELCSKEITLKPENFQFPLMEVDLVGFHLSWEEYKPTEERLVIIRSWCKRGC